MKKIKIGIMSFAHMHAYSYARCLKELSDVEFVGVADDKISRAKSAAKQFGVKAFNTYEEMLSSDIDAVIVCSENVNHRRHVVLAAQSEKHVLCEKPLSTNKHDAEAIVEVCKRSNVKLQTAFPCRFHSAYKALKNHVKSGELGDIIAIKGTNQGIYPGGWFSDTKLSGGGAVMDHTVHVLDLIRDLCGTEATKVYAEIDNRMFGRDFDDTGIISINFANGTFATIDASWSRPKNFPFWGNVTLELTGTKGFARMDMFAQKLDYISEKSGKFAYEYWGDDIDLLMIRSFVECIAEDKKPVVTGEDGARAVEVAAAAYESSKIGRAVDLPL